MGIIKIIDDQTCMHSNSNNWNNWNLTTMAFEISQLMNFEISLFRYSKFHNCNICNFTVEVRDCNQNEDYGVQTVKARESKWNGWVFGESKI